MKSTIKSLETTLQMKSVELSNKNERLYTLKFTLLRSLVLFFDQLLKNIIPHQGSRDGSVECSLELGLISSNRDSYSSIVFGRSFVGTWS